MRANRICRVFVVLLVVAGCSGSNEIVTTSTTQASAPAASMMTASTASQPESVKDSSPESLKECVVGEWVFDADGYVEISDTRAGGFILYDVVSGSGHLSIAVDQTLTASYDDLILDMHSLSDWWGPESPSEPDIASSSRVVVSGRVVRAYEAQGDVFSPGEIDELDISFHSTMNGEEIAVFPLHRGSFVHGPMVLEDGWCGSTSWLSVVMTTS